MMTKGAGRIADALATCWPAKVCSMATNSRSRRN